MVDGMTVFLHGKEFGLNLRSLHIAERGFMGSEKSGQLLRAVSGE